MTRTLDISKLATLLAIFATALGAGGCTFGDGDHFDTPDAGLVRSDTAPPAVVFDVQLAPTDVAAGVGDVFELEVRASDRNGNLLEGLPVDWNFDDDVLTRESGGQFRALQVGQTDVRATIDGIAGLARVTVGAQQLGSLQVTVSSTEFAVGEGATVSVVPLGPDGGPYRTPELLDIEVTTTNAGVATVDDDGQILGVGPGTAELVARAGDVESRVLLTVFEYELVSLTLDLPFDRLVVGESRTVITGTLWSPSRPPAFEVVITSSNPDVVEVDRSVGTRIRARSAGRVTLTASIDGYESTDSITIDAVDAVDGFALGESQRMVAIVAGMLLQRDTDGTFDFLSTERDRYLEVDAGFEHFCARVFDRTVDCMGLSSRGQAGVIQPIVTTPRSVSGPGLVDALRVSGDRSCYLIGTQWSCWGDVDETPTVVPAAVSYSAFSQGRDHTCVVAAGEVRCAGTNDSGQLGLGSFTPAGDGVVVSPASFEDVVVGADFTCARSLGATYCWGEGDDGQLGSLPLGDHASPRRVDTSEVFEDLVAGSAHACGLTAGGSVYCWGRNDSGQLGDASLQTRPTPVAADSPARFVEIDAANDETCGRTADGALYCWGRSNSSDVVRAFPERVRVQVGP